MRIITLFGDVASRTEVKTKIINHVQSLKLSRHSVELNAASLAKLLSGGLASLQSRYGEQNVRLDIVARTLEITGNEEEAGEAKELLSVATTAPKLQENLAGDEEDLRDCPICCCTIENPVRFECGHSYCGGCFDLCITSTCRSKSFPLCCITCNTKVGLSILRPLKDFDQLLSTSFSFFISSNSTTYAYCPTPDCPQIYRIGPVGTVAQCSECVIRICTFCKIEWHEGCHARKFRSVRIPSHKRTKLC